MYAGVDSEAGMNFDIEAADGKIPFKRGRDVDGILHADGISSFEARRINVLSRFKHVNSSDNALTNHKVQQKSHHSEAKKHQLATPMLSLKTASQQLQKVSLASALQSKRKIDAKGIFSNVKSGKYHTNAAPHQGACGDELAAPTSELPAFFLSSLLALSLKQNERIQSPAPPKKMEPVKKKECRKLDGNESEEFEEGVQAPKGDNEGIFVARASASYIHALREALGRKILYSAYPRGEDNIQAHCGLAQAPEGVFKDLKNQFRIVIIDDVEYAECVRDEFLVRCSDNAAFSGSTGEFIGSWQNEGYIVTD